MGAVALLTLLTATPASAAALTGVSWTVSDTAVRSYAGTYRWNFTTATTANLQSVRATVPSGTHTTNPYFRAPGSLQNYARTPDTPAASITGDLDIRVRVALDDWTPADYTTLLAKWDGTARGYDFFVYPGGAPSLMTSPNGSSYVERRASALPAIADGQPLWLRVTLDVDNGAGSNDTRFYTSSDGNTWTQLGTTRNMAGTSSTYDNGEDVSIGASWRGGSDAMKGNVYYASLHNGIGGPAVLEFEPSRAVSGSTTWTGSTGEVWTISQSGGDPADIYGPLTVDSIGGVPSNGTAKLRYVSNTMDYAFSSTSVGSGTVSHVGVTGLINTDTPGTYTSTITTRTASNIDTGTTAGIAFTDASEDIEVSVAQAAELTFGISGHVGSCNGAAQNGIASATDVSLGSVSAASNRVAAQDLTVTTNAAGGYTIYARYSNPLTGPGGQTLADVSGTHASPVSFPAAGTAAFGYTTSESALGSGTADRFTNGGPKWAAFTASNAEVSRATAPADTDTVCLAYQAGISPTIPAGTYSTTIIYTAVASF